jgi:predicted unusual protein kinase regulating ubiquinone biosynthesis (AarF/ABC1/UbiB family)
MSPIPTPYDRPGQSRWLGSVPQKLTSPALKTPADWELASQIWHTAPMTPTSREVARLDRVPLPVEALRVGATGWQMMRAGLRVLTRLPSRGPWQQKIIKEIPEAFADLGPTYVKFGQIIASSPGAFGEPLSREFRSLLDRVPPADATAIRGLFVEELGAEPTTLFADFDETPVASASIAQVHLATLHSGEEVVVKIQRPGIRQRVAADLQILKRFAQLVELANLGRRLSAKDIVADFADNLAEELDFRIEAQSMQTWVSHLHSSPLGKNIRVPTVYWDHTSERVLTMERVSGVRIDNVAEIKKNGFDGVELVKALLFSTFDGGLRHGLFHGDLHAGNLFVDDQGRVIFLDFGIMGRIDPRTRWLLRELVYALLVKKDHAAAGKIMVLMGAVGTTKPEAEAAKDLEEFSTPLTMKTLGDMSYAEIGRQLSTLAEAYDVKLPRELVLIGKQFLYVERYMKLLAPSWQMMSDPDLTGYFANFMVEVSREHQTEAEA